jgi:hypothetical protein
MEPEVSFSDILILSGLVTIFSCHIVQGSSQYQPFIYTYVSHVVSSLRVFRLKVLKYISSASWFLYNKYILECNKKHYTFKHVCVYNMSERLCT